MMKQLGGAVMAVLLCAGAVLAQAPTPLEERPFQENLNRLKAERGPTEKLVLAQRLIGRHRLTSLQVKTLAAALADDAARLEFATAAFPCTIDPDNFYEVYDAFVTFSKMMRLHDRVQQMRTVPPIPIVVAPPPVTEEEMQDILRSLRRESLDHARSQLARQIIGASRGNFLAAQVKDILKCFDFENTRLDLAKYAYDFTLDREKYYQVSEVFNFPSSKESLARYIESRLRPPPPPGRR